MSNLSYENAKKILLGSFDVCTMHFISVESDKVIPSKGIVLAGVVFVKELGYHLVVATRGLLHYKLPPHKLF